MQNISLFQPLKGFAVKIGIIGILLCCLPVFAANPLVELTAAKINKPNAESLQIELQLSGPLSASPKHFTTPNPARLVIDLPNVENKLTKQHEHIGKDGLNNIHVMTVANRTRVVVDLQQLLPYQVQQVGNHILINFSLTNPITNTSSTNQINQINFKRLNGNVAELSVDLANSDNLVELHQQGQQLLIQFNHTNVPNKLQNILDVASYDTPVSNIKVTQTDQRAELLINTKNDYSYNAYQIDKRYVVTLQPQTPASLAARANTIKSYQGKRISLNFQDIKVRAVLQLLAEFTGINIVASDAVQGSMTLQLNNIPWDQALDIILQTRGLDKRQVGNVILIAPAEEFANRERKELEAKQDFASLEQLRSELIQINYAKAQDIATLLKDKGNSLLSLRGNVSVDNRTNTVWVQDVPSRITEIRRLITQLDIPIKQVLIEARIVNIDKGFVQNLGVRFGVSNPNHVSGTLEGADSIAKGNTPAATDLKDRLNLDLRAPKIGDSNPATIGLALAKLGKNTLLDLELSALENEGAAEVISNPRIITANQMEAKIEAGEEIPYQESTSSGATSTAFKKAVLSLNVTPQITPDGRIILNLKVNQDKRGTQNVAGVPPIDTRNIQTQVLVDNGQTVVLGGIYEQEKNNQITRIPFLGKLPIVGALFRQKQVIDKRTELLIFVTPKIIKQSEVNL
ncbi:MAG: pilQ [Gammaproteobacteria bacterium]|nr:pilQ [Gammaproteobacteria bacterium]